MYRFAKEDLQKIAAFKIRFIQPKKKKKKIYIPSFP